MTDDEMVKRALQAATTTTTDYGRAAIDAYNAQAATTERDSGGHSLQ